MTRSVSAALTSLASVLVLALSLQVGAVPASAASPGAATGGAAAGSAASTAGDDLRGLVGEYFTMSAPGARDFAVLGGSALEPAVDFAGLRGRYEQMAGRGDHVTARWTGEVEVPSTGEYTFYAVGDNGFRVFVDGRPVVDHWEGDYDVEQTSQVVQLVAGRRYDFRVEHFQDTGGANLFLRWSGPGIAKQLVPASAFTPPTGYAAGKGVRGAVEYVNPLVGSTRGGNTYPGAVRPFGMLSWSPTSTRGDQTNTGASNGYDYNTTRLRGFSLTHVNGAGCHPGASGDVPIFPHVGEVTSSPTADTTDAVYASDFSHADESADPGRYRLALANGVATDFAATTRAGIGSFAFPQGKPANLLFRTSNSLNGSEDADIRIDPQTRTVSGSVLSGGFCSRRGNGGGSNKFSYYRLYFTAQFDRDFASTGTWVDGELRPGTTQASGGEGYETGAARAGRGSGGYVGFDTSTAKPVTMRVGISYTSAAAATANLNKEVRPRDTVARVASFAERDWDRHLKGVRVQGGTPEDLTKFYTAMYHSLLQPNVTSDVAGTYPGGDQQVHRLSEGQQAQYGNFSGWDQYRAHTQLLALLQPEVAGDFAQSLLNLSRQNGGVWDRWVHINGSTRVMTGDPSAPTLAGMHALGVDGFEVEAAFDSLARQATVPHPNGLSDYGCPGQCAGMRPNLAEHLRLGYAPQDDCHCWGGAAETLEAATADYGLADWARRLGREEQAEQFTERAGWWQNTFNPQATPQGGYQQARNADGSWVGPFDPGTGVGFAQGSSATYTWMVQHDVARLAQLMGGRERAAERLDDFFRRDDGTWTTGGPEDYDPTNEPGIHTPWLYNALGQPWKTQETVRAYMDLVYGTGPGGLPGNDDLGTMSAWYVWGALGMYPQTPSRGDMLLSSPTFPKAWIHRDGGPTITITAPGASEDNIYVQDVRLDGKAWDRSAVPASLLTDGGSLRVGVGPEPDRTWATDLADLPVDHGMPTEATGPNQPPPPPPPSPADGVLLDSESTEWSYLADNTDPATGDADRLSWTTSGFDDSAWPVARGSFGAKNGAASGMGGGHTVDTLLPHYIDGQGAPTVPTYFFRTSFDVTAAQLAAIQQLQASVVYDDAIVVYLNGQKVAGFEDAGITQNLQYGGSNGGDPDRSTFTIDRASLREGSNTLAVAVHQVGASSSDVYFDLESLTTTATAPVQPLPPGTPTSPVNGLRGDYHTVGAGPAYDFVTPAVSTVLDGAVDHRDLVPVYLERAGRAEGTGVRWTGSVTAPASGEYTFYATGDNGMRLWVGGRRIIDFWVNRWDLEQTSTTISLKQGERYDFRLETFQATGGANMFLRWSGPGIEKSTVPLTAFQPPADYAVYPAQGHVEPSGESIRLALPGAVTGDGDLAAGLSLTVDSVATALAGAAVSADGQGLTLTPAEPVEDGAAVRLRYDGTGSLTVAGRRAPALDVPLDNRSAYVQLPAWAPTAAPDRVVLTPTATPETSQAITWRTVAGVADGEVQIREKGSATVRTVAAVTSDELRLAGWLYGSRSHSAVADGLQPGTAYEYRVGRGEHRSDWYEFTTAVTDAPFEFIYFGDAQNDLAEKWAPVVDQAFQAFPGAVGTVNAGDLVNVSAADAEWTDWFGAMDGHAQTTNVIAAPGNHEYSGDAFLRQWKSVFEYPRNGPAAREATGDTPAQRQLAAYEAHMATALEETTYYTDYQDVRFISLNASWGDARDLMTPPNLPVCQVDCPRPEQVWLDLQGRWLDTVLADNPMTWAVATFHQPVFSTAVGRDERAVRDAWLPVLQRNDIDLVLMGHDHTYARGYVNTDATSTPGVTTGPVYVVSVSGPKYYDQQPADDNVWTRNGATQVTRAGQTSTFQGIRVDGDTLTYRAVIAAKGEASTAQGDVGDTLDSFTITKGDDGTKRVSEEGVTVPTGQ